MKRNTLSWLNDKKYIAGLVIPLMCLTFTLTAWGQGLGHRFSSEKSTVTDEVTGIKITALTTSSANDSKIYQTHPQWTSDGKYIIFRSNRTQNQQTQAFAVDVKTGTIIQLTEGDTNTGSLNVSRQSYKLYYTRGDNPLKLIELDLASLFRDSEERAMRDQAFYEREIATLPENLRESGGFTLDANEKIAYMGVSRMDEMPPEKPGQEDQRIRQIPGGIRAINLETGEISSVIDVPFRMGHVQANPFKSGEIVFCHETGGDAPQRIWYVNADGSGHKPLYKETPGEWVTHEVWVDADHVYFNVMAHEAELRKKATGIFSINVRNDEVEVLGQTDRGRGFWHNNGSADGKWAVGDNFDGDIMLINLENGRRRLLSTGHYMSPDHAHPSFSPDGKQILIQSGMLSKGKSLDLMLIDIPSDW